MERRLFIPSGSELRGIWERDPAGDPVLVPPDRYLEITREGSRSTIAAVDWGKNGINYLSTKYRYSVESADLEGLEVE